jgi:glycosyltransferase 2 family protein
VLRWSLFFAVAAGVICFVALLVLNGLGDILRGVAAVGWGLLLIVCIRLAALSLAGIAWGTALGRTIQRPAWLYIGLRIIREAINSLLPAAQIGGDLIGARLLTQFGVPAGLAGAGILVDVLLQTATQGLFAILGLAALWVTFGDGPIVREIGAGLLVAVPALGGFFMVQRLGAFALVDRGMVTIRRFWPGLVSERPLDLQPALRRLYADRTALGQASLLHFVGWTTGTVEIWLALGRMGAKPSGTEALVLESLGQAVRSAAFAVPGALGIQEGGFILLGSLFGLGASTSVALSLIKRIPDFAIGLPGLLGWQVLEAARLRLPAVQSSER